ncbi:MAG TPA: CcmD family protein [Gaiellaceae bacterium]|nr:CcmD family protein [Gaiellaceae bacterium]
MTSAETYVTAAYCVIFGLVLLYVVLIALKLQRLQRDVEKLSSRKDEDG